MMEIKAFTVSPFSENSYVVYDETKECVIVDPGFYSSEEKQSLKTFIDEKGLKPTRLLNTHCHCDHVFGNAFVHRTYGLIPECHVLDIPTLELFPQTCQLYGLNAFEPSPEPKTSLKEGDDIFFGNSQFKILFVPGHAPGHVAFYSEKENFILSGDVLFERSVGRTDLPGGDPDVLLESIRSVMYSLADETIVYSGHGNPTSIGNEKKSNPFVKG